MFDSDVDVIKIVSMRRQLLLMSLDLLTMSTGKGEEMRRQWAGKSAVTKQKHEDAKMIMASTLIITETKRKTIQIN